jgi:ribosomal protein L32E
VGNSRSFKRRHKDVRLTPTEKRLQKKYRKATGTDMKVRLRGKGRPGDPLDE